jgi:hypothetical protein
MKVDTHIVRIHTIRQRRLLFFGGVISSTTKIVDVLLMATSCYSVQHGAPAKQRKKSPKTVTVVGDFGNLRYT